MAKHFSHFENTGKQRFFYLETEWFLRISGDKSRKRNWNWRVWLQTNLSNFVRSLAAQMSRAKEDVSTLQMLLGYEYAWNWLNHYDDDATVTISHNSENRSNQRVSFLFKGYQKKSRANGTRKETQQQGVEKRKWKPFVSSAVTASPLTRAFACHSKWRDYFQSKTFVGGRACSLFVQPVYVRNSEE